MAKAFSAPSSAASLVTVTDPSGWCHTVGLFWQLWDAANHSALGLCLVLCSGESVTWLCTQTVLSTGAETCCAEEAPDSGETQLFHNWT